MFSFKKCRFLSGNALKIIAAITMLIDHIGVILYPNSLALRAVGRLAFPIFAFFIAEGCRYTKNKTKYFCLLSTLAVLCQVVARIAVPSNDLMSILLTFTGSVALIYALQFAKKCTFARAKWYQTTLAWLLFLGGVAGAYFLTETVQFDYGFWGMLTPVFASLFDFKRDPAPAFLQKLDKLPLRILCTAIPLFMLGLMGERFGLPQWYAFFSLVLLLLYSGERGKWKMKYFFYIFYPAHLVVLYGISIFFF